MTSSDRPVTPAAIAVDVLLGIVFAAGIAFTAYALADSWGGSSWVLTSIVGTVVGLLAVARRVNRAWTAVTALAVALVAVPVARVGDLPNEPAPMTALALSVLIGSAIRKLPVNWALGIAGGGLAVVLGAWIAGGFTAIAVLSTLGWLAALAIGFALRSVDVRGAASRTRRPYDPAYQGWDGTRAP